MEVKLQVKYINEHGDEMTLRKCNSDKFWFKHTDCNKDFEVIDTKHFKYILDETEQIVLRNFIKNN